jgi:cytochrome c oxidase cbb3-type subunit I/II
LRYREYSRIGESIYDRPAQWGSRRIGPDLARKGGTQSSYWHWTHLENPAVATEGSVMPSFQHLLQDQLQFKSIQPRIATAHYLGVPYDRELTESEPMAKQQAETIAAEIIAQGGPVAYQGHLIKDSTAIALIAYLQRLGTDLSKPAPITTSTNP